MLTMIPTDSPKDSQPDSESHRARTPSGDASASREGKSPASAENRRGRLPTPPDALATFSPFSTFELRRDGSLRLHHSDPFIPSSSPENEGSRDPRDEGAFHTMAAPMLGGDVASELATGIDGEAARFSIPARPPSVE